MLEQAEEQFADDDAEEDRTGVPILAASNSDAQMSLKT